MDICYWRGRRLNPRRRAVQQRKAKVVCCRELRSPEVVLRYRVPGQEGRDFPHVEPPQRSGREEHHTPKKGLHLARARQLSRRPWRCAKTSHTCARDATPGTPCIPSRSRLSQPRHSTHSQLPHGVRPKPFLRRHRRHRFHWHRRYCHCRRCHQEPASACMCAFCAHHGRPHSSFHCVLWLAVGAQPFHTCAYGDRLHMLRIRSPPSRLGQQQAPWS